jgi:hypothetical protein
MKTKIHSAAANMNTKKFCWKETLYIHDDTLKNGVTTSRLTKVLIALEKELLEREKEMSAKTC